MVAHSARHRHIGGVPERCSSRWQTDTMSHSSTISSDVRNALLESQRLGFLGDREIDDVIEHARAFVRALDQMHGVVADLGSGGGIPGLVIAHDRPELQLMLIDRRSKRTDFLDRMVRRLGWSDRVTVVNADVTALVEAKEADGSVPSVVVDAAVARGFGPPQMTLTLASRLVRPGGRIVISEPPEGDRWSQDLLTDLCVRRIDGGAGTVSVFETGPS